MDIKEFRNIISDTREDLSILTKKAEDAIVELFKEKGITEITLHNQYNSEDGDSDPVYLNITGEGYGEAYEGIVTKIVANDPDHRFEKVSIYVVDINEGKGLIHTLEWGVSDLPSIMEAILDELKYPYKD